MGPFQIKACLFVAVWVGGALIVCLPNWWSKTLCAWPTSVYAFVLYAYVQNAPRLLMKTPRNGTHSWAVCVFLAPFFGICWTAWYYREWRYPSDGFTEITPRIYLGRYCRDPKSPVWARVTHIVDMTAEFSRPRWAIDGPHYRCVPTLDTLPPPDDLGLQSVVESMRCRSGVTYVHCAAGHGRSCLVLVIYLVVTKQCESVDQAFFQIQKTRPRVHLHPEQWACARRVCRTIQDADGKKTPEMAPVIIGDGTTTDLS